MNEAFDPSIMIFAALAVFVIWKLRSVLGTRTGLEKTPFNPFSGQKRDGSTAPAPLGDNVVRMPGAPAPAQSVDAEAPLSNPARWSGFAQEGTALWTAFDNLAGADSTFHPKTFLEGAKSAYEMIVTAYAKGDTALLNGLLSKDVFDSFAAALTARSARGETAESTFVSMDQATIEDAQQRGKIAQISVRFKTNLINATRDSVGNVVDGDPEKVVPHVDLWTFSRDTNSKDPNWKLVATESPV